MAPAAVTDEEVRKVAAIVAETRRLTDAAQPKINAAATAEAKAAAQADLARSMQAAVAAQGISVTRYNEIARAVPTDTALAGRLSAAMPASAVASPAAATTTAQ